MIMNEKRQLHLRIPVEEYKKLKVKCAYDGTSMQDYIVSLIDDSLGGHPTRGASILLVEDEKILRESLRDALKDTHTITTAETGEEAIELTKNNEFDILIADVRLPGKSGIEVIKEVRQTKPYMRCIVITAYPSVELAVEAMKYGAVDYLVKPVHFDQLENLIWENLSRARGLTLETK